MRFFRFFAFTRDSVAPTFIGWTPGLRALAGGRALACGCLTGTYRTRRDAVVVILDARGDGCPHAHHRRNVVLWRMQGEEAQATLEEPSCADQV
jgi:hypothetical protein